VTSCESCKRLTLPFMRGQGERCTGRKLRLKDHLGLFWRLSPQQLKPRQHQPAHRETEAVVQNTHLLRHEALRHAIERLLQLAPGRGHISSNDHLKILTTTDATSRVVLQQH